MSPKHDIRLLRINYLRGPNIWTYRSVLEVWLDLGDLEDFPSNKLPGLTDRLIAWLPALVEHHCGVGERGGFIERLREGTWAGHILEHVVIELLNLAGMPTGFGQTRETSNRGVYRMVFRARDEAVARAALAEAHALLIAAIRHGDGAPAFDVAAAVARLVEQIDDSYLGPSTASIVSAATDRGIPHLRLNEGNLVQLGHGRRQRRIWTAETDRTSAIAGNIAHDKDLTKSLLASCGVPVPEGQVVESPEAAWEAAQEIGLPVVVKPSDANHGRGVSLDLSERADIEKAFTVADAEGSEVIVERYILGDEHRLLVVGGRVVAAARGESLSVLGDGRSTVEQLIDSQLNSDPRRGEAEEYPLETIHLDREPVMRLLLERQGLSGEAVPVAGRRVMVQRNGNVAIDCTDDVHPEVAHAATLAARIVGLDVAGIDLVVQDIRRPLQAQGGAVVEVNAGPGLLMHLKPATGLARPVGRAIVDHLFDDGGNGRVPIVGVAGSNHGNAIARLVGWLLHLSGHKVGLACQDGLFLCNRRVDARPSAHWDAGHRLLMNREVDAVVLENGAAVILDDGLAYDRCAVGVVTDLDHVRGLERHDVHNTDQLYRVLRTQVDVVLPDGVAVLNADDARVAQMADLCDGDVILYGLDAGSPALQAHRASGRRTVSVSGEALVLAQGAHKAHRVRLDAPVVQGLVASLGLHTLMAVAAAAWALDVSPELMAAGIETSGLLTAPAVPIKESVASSTAR
ncbi:cyanophycin synthetase [Hydrogenophaga sp. BPS33]|uniref:cyanophycin synthetase n=1 Tax=Hydrogenophaga sp. BPS33 TaxID=2651974 RepID=UPI00131F8170|nr:cyanophycin synthetase [Hydrogenophaga sp. BPS33]QHE85297.1 cyanophycin synthetase [Hydrogenophaga sp. BPS33]